MARASRSPRPAEGRAAPPAVADPRDHQRAYSYLTPNTRQRTLTFVLAFALFFACALADMLGALVMYVTVSSIAVAELANMACATRRGLNVVVERTCSCVHGAIMAHAILIAAHVYADGMPAAPRSATPSEKGVDPMLLWRVTSLPYILCLAMICGHAPHACTGRATQPSSAAASVMCELYCGGVWVAGMLSSGFVLLHTGGTHYFVLVVVLTELNDAWQWLFGRMCSGRDSAQDVALLRMLSPSKTLEGYAGGLLMTVATAFFVGERVLFGALVWGAGSVGDLTMSWYKRVRGVKDGGGVLPGHGGAVDRIDSLLFALPASVAFCAAFGYRHLQMPANVDDLMGSWAL